MRTFVLAFFVIGCGSDSTEPPSEPPPAPINATYHQTIKPILDAKCVTCHVDGGIGPFALDTYAAAAENAFASAQAVTTKLMPPWKANNDCREYVGDRSLDQSQIDAITAWVQQGTPEGDPATPGAPLTQEMPTLSRVDATLAMPEAYTPNAAIDDDYRCFVLPWPTSFTQKSFVTGFRAVPGNDQVVHHVIAFLAAPNTVAQFRALDDAEAGPGYTCFGGAGGPASGMIGGWAPGTLGSDLPPGIGLPVEAGSAIILQVHYNTSHGTTGSDLTSIDLKIDSTVQREGLVMPWANPQWPGGNMPIAANDPDVTHAFSFDPTPFTGEVEIFAAGLHMHTLGTSGRLQIERANGEQQCMLQIDDWDFHWQGSYGFAQSELLRRGDKLSIECHWDNSAGNQHEGGTPKNVNWGEGTGDEMCVGFFLTAPIAVP